MDTLAYIILFTFIGSIVSLIGGIILLMKEKFAVKISHLLASFAAGALLGTAFIDLMPEALEHSKEAGLEINIFWWVLIGFLIFFLLERFIYWFHHHHDHPGKETKPVVSLVILGDGVHNFIDGVAIAAAFLVSIPLGVVTAMAVAAHEIPQEIGDFGILLHHGVKRAKVLWLNILSAATALVGAILTYLLQESIESSLPIFLSVTAGFFIYIAASDLIPEIHGEKRQDYAFWETVLLLLGVLVVFVAISMLEGKA